MKSLLIAAFALLAVSEASYACPDLSGDFKFIDDPWNGSIRVEQNGCQKVTITRTRQVPLSEKFPLGTFTETRVLKTDGQPYVGYADSSERAVGATDAFQKVAWENDRLVIRQYFGPADKCQGKYFFNRGQCHVTEYSVDHFKASKAYAWTQTGLWFTEGAGYHSDLYALKKKNTGAPDTSRVASY